MTFEECVAQTKWASWAEFRGGRWIYLNQNENWVGFPPRIRYMHIFQAPLAPSSPQTGIVAFKTSGEILFAARLIFPYQLERLREDFRQQLTAYATLLGSTTPE